MGVMSQLNQSPPAPSAPVSVLKPATPIVKRNEQGQFSVSSSHLDSESQPPPICLFRFYDNRRHSCRLPIQADKVDREDEE